MMTVMMVFEVGVVDVLPVRVLQVRDNNDTDDGVWGLQALSMCAVYVLQVEYNNIVKVTIDPSKEPNAHSEKPGKPMIGPGFEQIMMWVTNILIWISFLL